MAKRESTFTNMALTLFLVSFISATILGFVQDLTKDAIAEASMKAQNDAIKNILPEFTELGDSWKSAPATGGDSLEFFPAYKGTDNLVGVAIKSYSKNGFGGLIEILVGITPDGTITGYEVLKHQETPGLGSKMDIWFKNADKPKQNIIGKNPDAISFTVSKDGGDIDAITASTITSRAFLSAVNLAVETFLDKTSTDGTSSATSKPENEPVSEQLNTSPATDATTSANYKPEEKELQKTATNQENKLTVPIEKSDNQDQKNEVKVAENTSATATEKKVETNTTQTYQPNNNEADTGTNQIGKVDGTSGATSQSEGGIQ